MDRKTLYYKIIQSGFHSRIEVGLEKHHIMPKSIFDDVKAKRVIGIDCNHPEDPENIVFLDRRRSILEG